MFRTLSQLIGFNPDGPETIGKKASPLKDCAPKDVRIVLGKKICGDGMQEDIWEPATYNVTESFEGSIGTPTNRCVCACACHNSN